MRRKEREISDKNELLALADRAEYGIFSMVDGDKPYAVALNIVRIGDVFYAHMAGSGKKLEVLAKNPQVMISLVLDASFFRSDFQAACGATMHYKSVHISGTAEILTAQSHREEHLRALARIAERFDSGSLPLQPAVVARTTVVRIGNTVIEGRRNPA